MDLAKKEILFPERTKEVQLAASRKGTKVRQDRSALKKAIKKGSMDPVEALRIEEPYFLGMRTCDFIKSLPRVGKVGAKKIMVELNINDKRRIRGMGSIQRKQLTEYLSSKY